MLFAHLATLFCAENEEWRSLLELLNAGVCACERKQRTAYMGVASSCMHVQRSATTHALPASWHCRRRNSCSPLLSLSCSQERSPCPVAPCYRLLPLPLQSWQKPTPFLLSDCFQMSSVLLCAPSSPAKTRSCQTLASTTDQSAGHQHPHLQRRVM